MIIEILDKMLLAYYTLNLKQPNGIEMNMPTVRKAFEKEIDNQTQLKVDYSYHCQYRGIPITFDDRETFIRLMK